MDTEAPRVGQDDLVHDDHTRERIIHVDSFQAHIWRVRVAEHEQAYHVIRLPALDQSGRRAYTANLDAVKDTMSTWPMKSIALIVALAVVIAGALFM